MQTKGEQHPTVLFKKTKDTILTYKRTFKSINTYVLNIQIPYWNFIIVLNLKEENFIETLYFYRWIETFQYIPSHKQSIYFQGSMSQISLKDPYQIPLTDYFCLNYVSVIILHFFFKLTPFFLTNCSFFLSKVSIKSWL